MTPQLTLILAPHPTVRINYLALKAVILNTFAAALLRVDLHGDIPLRPGDDPFDSNKQEAGTADEDCQVIVQSWPIQGQMTYGLLVDAMAGLQRYMVRDFQNHEVEFGIEHKELGVIGTGRVVPNSLELVRKRGRVDLDEGSR